MPELHQASATVVQTCPLCGGRVGVHLRDVQDPMSRQRFDIWRCNGCGLGLTQPMPEDLAPYYADYHGGRHGATLRWCVDRRLSILNASAQGAEPGSLLDIGCGDGSFLLAAQERGWKVAGTEFNPELARQKGLEIFSGIGEIGGSQIFDCITLWHSLEHLREPVETLTTIRNLLSPTGVLIIAVPDSQGLQATLFGGKWFHLDVPRHLFHYGKMSLSALLQSTGFLPVEWRHQEFEYDLLGWPQSALNSVLATPNVFFGLLTKRSPSCSPAERVVSYLCGTALTALSVPLVALGTLIKRGGTLIVAAHPYETTDQ